MKKWLKNLSGAVMASLLAITLNGKAYADAEDQQLPDEAPTMIVEASDPAPAPAPAPPPESAPVSAAVPADTAAPPVAEAAPAPAPAPVTVAAPVEVAAPAVAETASASVSPVAPDDVPEAPAVDPGLVEAPAAVSGIPVATETAKTSVVDLEASADAAETIGDETPVVTPSAGVEMADTYEVSAVKENVQQPEDVKVLENEEKFLPEVAAKDVSSDIPVKLAKAEKLSMAKDGFSSEGKSGTAANLISVQNHSENSSLEDEDEKELEKQLEESAKRETGTEEPVGGGNEAPTETSAPENNPIRVLDDGSYVMVNHSGTENLRSDGDISILAAGLNRVSSISGTGTVQITGTGILLVDKLAGNLSLQTFTDIYSSDPYKNGSVAVFVRQEDDGTYLLVNGDVTGLLDEEYKIEGVTLVLPENTSLLLFGTGAKPIEDDDGNVTDVEYFHGTNHQCSIAVPDGESVDEARKKVIESAGILTVAESAELIVKQGARVLMECLESLRENTHFLYPELVFTEGGKLTVAEGGSVSGSGVVKFDSSAGTLSGEGSISASGIIANITEERSAPISNSGVRLSSKRFELMGEGTVENLKIRNSTVFPDNKEIRIVGLDNEGDSTIILPAESVLDIGNVEGTLHLSQRGYYHYKPGNFECDEESGIILGTAFYSDDDAHTITGTISGNGKISFDSGIYHLQNITIGENVTFSENGGGLVFDYTTGTGVIAYSLSPLHVQPSDLVRADDESANGSIPIVAAKIKEYSDVPVSTNLGAYDDVGFAGIKTVTVMETVALTRMANNQTEQIENLSASPNGENLVLSLAELKKVVKKNIPEDLPDPRFNGWGVVVEFLHKKADNDETALTTSFYSWSSLSALPDSLIADDVCLIRISYVHNEDTIAPGGSATQSGTLYTGSGILGGSGAGSVYTEDTGHSGDGGDGTDGNNSSTAPELNPTPTPGPTPVPEPVSILNPVPAPLAAYVEEVPVEAPAVWVEVAPVANDDTVSPKETTYILLALEGEKTLEQLGGTATVSMSYTPPVEYVGKPLYVVFRNEDGSLTAIRASYSEITGQLRFIADRLGEFMVVGFDFDGEEFSEEFYEALAKMPELKNLVFTEVGVI